MLKSVNIIRSIIIIILFSIDTFASGGELKTHKIADSAQEICPILVGEKIPQLELHTADGNLFDMNEALSKKPTILIFYRGGWCPFCNLHLAELNEIEDDLMQLGYQIIAVSMDRPSKLSGSMEKHGLKFTLLSDSTAAAAQALGIAFRVSDDYFTKLKSYNMDLEQASGLKHHILPVPAVFIIGTDGLIRFEYVNPNYKVRIKAEVLLAAARAYLTEK